MKKDIVSKLFISAAVLSGLTLASTTNAQADSDTKSDGGGTGEIATQHQATDQSSNVATLRSSAVSNNSEVTPPVKSESQAADSNQNTSTEPVTSDTQASAPSENAGTNLASSDSKESTEPVVHNLKSADAPTIEAAKKAATVDYNQTGKAQVITASDAAEATQTGKIIINYVDQDTNQPITFVSQDSTVKLQNGSDKITGSITHQESVTDPHTVTASNDIAKAWIKGYKFIKDSTTDLNLGTESENKTITAYYQKVADVKVEYVDEDNPDTVIYSMTMLGSGYYGNEDYDVSYDIPQFWGYQYDAASTDQTALKGIFKGVDEVTSPVIIQVKYKKTGTDKYNPSEYVNSPLGTWESNLNDKTGATHQATGDLGISNPNDNAVIGQVSLPTTAVKISGDKEPARYQNYTLTATAGFQTPTVKEKFGTYTSHIANQPVKVVFVDDTAGRTIITSRELGQYDPSTNIIPTGDYDTSTALAEVTQKGLLKGYKFVQVNGMTKGTFDDVYRNVFYHFVHTATNGTAQTTRTINFIDDKGQTLLPSVTQQVDYGVATDNVTGESVYTPQGAYYQYEAPKIEGYTADDSAVDQLAPKVTTVKPENTVATVVYSKAGDTTVTYTLVPISTDGTPIGDSQQLTGNTGDVVTDFPDIKGYTVVPNQKITVPEANQKVTVIYTTATNTPVSFNLVPITLDGTPIGTPKNLTGITGDPIKDLPTIDGYTLVPNQKVTVPEDGNDVTVIYTTTATNTPVSFNLIPITTDGTPIGSPQQLTGTTGDPITNLPTIDGYTLVPNQKVTVPEKGNDVTVIYTTTDTNTPVSFNLIPITTDGTPIGSPQQLTGITGNPITNLPTIDGYTLVPNQKVMVPEKGNDVTVIYMTTGNNTTPGNPGQGQTGTPTGVVTTTETPTGTATTTTDTPTQTVAETPTTDTSTDTDGDTSEMVSGSDDNTISTTTADDTNANESNKTEKVATTSGKEQTKSVVLSAKNQTNSNQQAKLPQTNETQATRSAVIGLSLLAGMVGMLAFARKPKRND